MSRVLAIVVRAIETDLIHRAGLTRRSHARTGVVTLIQRFGSALNLNVHLHMIVLDGVYTEHNGQARFHPVGAPSPCATLLWPNRLNKAYPNPSRSIAMDFL